MAENQENATPPPATATPRSRFSVTYGLSPTSSQLIPRIRGRMRKYRSLESMGALPSPERAMIVPPSFQAVHSTPSINPASARNRGIKALVQVLGSQRLGLVPSVIYIKPGEDVYSNILSFSHQEGSVCILSACGALSRATIQKTTISGGTITYEGYFQIMSLVGSYYALSGIDGWMGKTRGFNITISGDDGRVFGGCVAGPLRAATTVQVVLGKFHANAKTNPTDNLGMPPNNQDVGAP